MLHRGSEWHKWDLHVHTPESVLKNDFGRDWDNYVKALFKKAIAEDIAVIGITDYFLLEGYKILRNEYLENIEKLNQLFSSDEISKIGEILVLPNIEFRLKRFVGGNPKDLDKLNRKLNYHVIFSNEASIEDVEGNFLNQLHFDHDAGIGEKIETLPLNRTNLEQFGKKLKSEHQDFRESNKSDLFIGMMNAAVDESQIAEILNKKLFRNKYLMGPNPDEDLSRVSWNSQGHNTRKTLIKQSHFVFSSNPGTIKFMSGESYESRAKFKSEFGDIKPCLWGSDAHNYDELFSPDERRHTWIKSNRTFSGLKQVIYDPDSRVCIQELSPQVKNSYQTIKRVRFKDNRSNSDFSADWIPISKDLTTIIGGKSSGKSLLLHHIAKTINFDEVIYNSKISHASTYESYQNDDKFEFEVEWENGEISKLNDRSTTKPITYISQLYINQLAEKEGKDQLNYLVRDILTQNDVFKRFIDNVERDISGINQSISSNISVLFLLRENYKGIVKEIDKIGVKSSIQNEVEKLKTEIDELRKKSGFTSEEDLVYKALTKRLLSLKNRKKFLSDIQEYAKQIGESSVQKSSETSSDLQRSISAEFQFPKESLFVRNVFSHLEEKISEAILETVGYTEERVSKIPNLTDRIEADIRRLEGDLVPLSSKVKDQNALVELQQKLAAEQTKIVQIQEKEIKRESVEEQGRDLHQVILDDYEKLIKSYICMTEEVGKPAYQLEKGISIQATVEFNSEKFDEFVSAFDRRGNINDLLGPLSDKFGNYIFNPLNHAFTIKNIFHKLRKASEIPTIRKGITDEEIAKRLFSDCFSLSFIVNYNGDEIAKMSPGKRGLVLLNLILHLSNASHPILIDQPEDNLDNRTIYDQLNGFIRLRKKSRQIIMVTHNANLVVASDSECVIVANQDGQYVEKDNREYKFEYCSGAIENSFESSTENGLLYQKGIQQHICEILEGGVVAFKEREMKYGFKH